MHNLKELFKASAKELKDMKTMAVTAMLIAVAVVLGFFGTVQIGDYLKIGFSFIANELAALMFGPVVGSVMAGTADIIKYLLKPTGPFFPGFTISAIVGGLIYGCMLYKKPVSLKRIAAAKAIVAVLVNMLLNTFWLSMLYGQAFNVLLPARALKQLVMVPVETILFYAVVMVLQRAHVFGAIQMKARK